MDDVKYKLGDDIDLQPMESQLLVLDLRQNAYFALNETARFFVESLAKEQCFDDIVDAALEMFDVQDKAQLQKDFELLLAELLEMGIIVRI